MGSMKNKSYRRFYIGTLVVLLSLSAYPLVNGIRMIGLAVQNGAVEAEQYAKYVIPYFALCLAVIIVAAAHPLTSRLRRGALAVPTLLTLGIFTAIELAMETIPINVGVLAPIDGAYVDTNAALWQASLCYISPEAIEAARQRDESFAGANGFYYASANAAYKLHYFLVCFIIIILVVGVIHTLGKMTREGDFSKKRKFILQLVSAVTLVALCVFANLTGFFRDTSPIQTPLASVLTAFFFVALGAAFGIYIGSFLLGRKKAAAIPVLAATLIVCTMYYGEYILLGGSLYRFGTGWFFEPIFGFAAAPADLVVVLLSGVVTALVLRAANPNRTLKN